MRPATGQLYGVGSTGRLYLIDASSGRASMVGSAPLALAGTRFGVDFNPTVDRLRIVSDAGENLRVNPDTGALVLADGALTAGFIVTAAAYTNNFAGATTTALFDLDTTGDQLLLQNPPNAGMLTVVGALGIDVTPTAALRHQRHDWHRLPRRRDRWPGSPVLGRTSPPAWRRRRAPSAMAPWRSPVSHSPRAPSGYGASLTPMRSSPSRAERRAWRQHPSR